MLRTTYMGLNIPSPLIIASSGLSLKLDNLLKMQEYGAGAIVMKSIFQEDIDITTINHKQDLDYTLHSECPAYFDNVSKNTQLDSYLEIIEKAVKNLSIPVIGSLNCTDSGEWVDYALRLENIGVQGLELNINFITSDYKIEPQKIEEKYIKIVSDVINKVKIPVSVKLSQNWTSLPNFFYKLEKVGVKGIVLFNNLYKPDIDINNLKIKTAPVLSVKELQYYSLRWIGMMSGDMKLDFSATSGIWSGEDAIKQLLVGAKSVQLCSVLYKNGFEPIKNFNNFIIDWMKDKKYNSIKDFTGILCQEKIANPEIFERSQYIRSIMGTN